MARSLAFLVLLGPAVFLLVRPLVYVALSALGIDPYVCLVGCA